ncbi:hypothetical protein KFK09_017563 [Dendrobium nobile]|uniref:Hydroxymethylglutaryl-CoA synthase n=1 Tax=Dendrobium nobile TaxID=94219 RepID=A0A8T3B3D6_DENNO|nr:hypothetical protein KFK09_017563 [Dendrobium nobile]
MRRKYFRRNFCAGSPFTTRVKPAKIFPPEIRRKCYFLTDFGHFSDENVRRKLTRAIQLIPLSYKLFMCYQRTQKIELDELDRTVDDSRFRREEKDSRFSTFTKRVKRDYGLCAFSKRMKMIQVVTLLLEKCQIGPKKIGCLEDGNEINIDIEGVDYTNAYYGGIAALFNCVNWVESSSRDGIYELVVCTYNMVLSPARPTCGAAYITILIRQNDPIIFESKYRRTHMSHIYDFYKHVLASEYLLVQKSFSRLYFNDYLRQSSHVDSNAKAKPEPIANLTGDESYQNLFKHFYDEKVQPSTLMPKQVGNMYTASLYAALASVIHNKHETLGGQRIVNFAFGSGLASCSHSNLMMANIHSAYQT